MSERKTTFLIEGLTLVRLLQRGNNESSMSRTEGVTLDNGSYVRARVRGGHILNEKLIETLILRF